MKSMLLRYLWLVFSLFTLICEVSSKSRHNVKYPVTVLSDGWHKFTENFGQVASFSNASIKSVSGRLYEPPSSLKDCSLMPSNVNTSAIDTPKPPFVVFTELPDCPYSQAQIAEAIGASGIVFYSSTPSEYLDAYMTSLSLLVSLVSYSSHNVRSIRNTMDFSRTNISVTIEEYSTYMTQSHTFYFVVFAFSVLVMLSITWFIITYAKRCHSHFVLKRRRNANQRRTMQTINKLPTKKYKRHKQTSDTDSLSSLDEPNCAVCLESFQHNDLLRTLPCKHEFHVDCIDPWLQNKGNCPLCKYSILKDFHQSSSSIDTPPNELSQHDEINNNAPHSNGGRILEMAAVLV